MAVRVVRFDMVKDGAVFQYKFGQFVKLPGLVKSVHNPALYNAVTESGQLTRFYPFDEVRELGSFIQNDVAYVKKEKI